MLLPYLQHILKEFEDLTALQILSDTAKSDLILTLVEASQFSDIEWKRRAIALAKMALPLIDDPYVQACVFRRDFKIRRIEGDQDFLVLAQDHLANNSLQHNTGPMMNAELGHLTLQISIDLVQKEELAQASEYLRKWQPSRPNSPSKAEQIVSHELAIWRGKVLRYQGDLQASLTCLQQVSSEIEHEVLYGDIRSQLACNLGDVYCELGQPADAERLLNQAIERLNNQGLENSVNWHLLQLSRAESLFGQGKFTAAEVLCLKIRSSPRLNKFGGLYLSTLLARLYHTQSNWTEAFKHWGEALRKISDYPLINADTSRIILQSQEHVLSNQNNLELVKETQKQIIALKKNVRPNGNKYWIPGLRQWYSHLKTLMPTGFS